MHMSGLKQLHQSMIDVGVDMQQFRVKTGAVEFDCIFSVRETPFALTLTSRGAGPRFFKFDVKNGYSIVPFLGDKYEELRTLLFIDGSSRHRLDPKQFLSEVNGLIPQKAQKIAVPTDREIIRIRHDIDDRERPYFDRWEQRGKGPSLENLQKTLLILGQDAHDFSVKANKSSIWSATETNKSWR